VTTEWKISNKFCSFSNLERISGKNPVVSSKFKEGKTLGQEREENNYSLGIGTAFSIYYIL
jgi:hypothetical protein